MLRFSLAAAAVTASVVFVGTAQATPFDLTNPSTSKTIAEILAQPGPDAGKFIVFDKLFTINSFTPGAGSPAAFQAANITVAGRNNGIDGAGFRIFNQWADVPGDSSAFGFVLDYDVSILPSYAALGYKITGVILSFNGAAGGPGSLASVDETVYQGANQLGSPRVLADGILPEVLMDMVSVPMTTSLNAVKDFKLFAPSTGGIATASFIEQLFKQVPAPSGAGLAAAGLVLMARRRR